MRNHTNESRICRGAYTDVDLLVLKLLKLENTYKWVKLNEPIAIGSSIFFVQKDKDCIIVENTSCHNFLCTPETLYFCDQYGEHLQSAFQCNVLLNGYCKCQFRKENYKFLCLKDKDSYFFIEIGDY